MLRFFQDIFFERKKYFFCRINNSKLIQEYRKMIIKVFDGNPLAANQKAIDAYNVEHRKHPQDQALVKEYVKSLEDIKSAADKALDKEDFAPAGRNYNVLLKNYPCFKGFEKRLSFNSSYLNMKLSHCKQSLSKQGFQEYRKGNLSHAISLWQVLLAIDPHNTEIKDALRTAKLQQKNLQEEE
jgi:hypothetical protein